LDWIGLKVNRKKTQVVNLQEKRASLDLPRFTSRDDRDMRGRDKRYLNVFSSRKALKKEQEQLRVVINARIGCASLPAMIASLNRHLWGWANYFSFGYPTTTYRAIHV
jgi:RNA-directed DNA polymerase